jgi:hypothetical protein
MLLAVKGGRHSSPNEHEHWTAFNHASVRVSHPRTDSLKCLHFRELNLVAGGGFEPLRLRRTASGYEPSLTPEQQTTQDTKGQIRQLLSQGCPVWY